jgi:hypothetical protein
VCIRFSAWSKTIEAALSKTSFGDFHAVDAEFAMDQPAGGHDLTLKR